MKKILLVLILLAAIGAVAYFVYTNKPAPEVPIQQTATTTPPAVQPANNLPATTTVIGMSVKGRPIVAYHFGSGPKELLFIGGIHGGYEWNTVLTAYEMMDYLTASPGAVPASETVTIIPVLNPDGLNVIIGTDGRFAAADVKKSLEETIPGRFNANTVDLGRNFDCEWKPTSKWQTKTVSGGSAPFSEPESAAVKSYIESHAITAAVVWYSSAGGVFSSSCGGGISADTKMLTEKYATASGYPAHESFDFYAITGDIVNWFAKKNIPAISVLLTNHTDTESAKNRAGEDAVLAAYTK